MNELFETEFFVSLEQRLARNYKRTNATCLRKVHCTSLNDSFYNKILIINCLSKIEVYLQSSDYQSYIEI